METSGVFLRQVSGFSGVEKRQSIKHLCFSGGEKILLRRSCTCKFHCFSVGGKLKISSVDNLLSPEKSESRESGFSDKTHLLYYVSPRSSGKSGKPRGKDFPALTTKKKVKLLKGLSKDLSLFSAMSNAEGEGLIGEVKSRMITEAAKFLLAQMKQLRAVEKEIKRRKKEEKAALKAAGMKVQAAKDRLRIATRMKARAAKGAKESSSGSSSESSNSECELVDMNRLRATTIAIKPDSQASAVQSSPRMTLDSHDPIHELPVIPVEEVKNINFSTQDQGRGKDIEHCANSASCGEDISDCCSRTSVLAVEARAKRIEVCMGGKCKKSGAVQLLEEFERRVGIEGAVLDCKCMGKCRDGPNVRVLSKDDGKSVNPLCIGVGLEDVGVILSNFFGEKDLGTGLAA